MSVWGSESSPKHSSVDVMDGAAEERILEAREELERIREEARLAKIAKDAEDRAKAAADVDKAKAELALLREEVRLAQFSF